MSWNISDEVVKKLLAGPIKVKNKIQALTISMGDGDGTGGNDTINDSGLDLAKFKTGSFLSIQSGDANDEVRVRVLSSAAGILNVPAGSFTAVAAGSIIGVVEYDVCGALAEIFQNGKIALFSQARPVGGANEPEPGVPLLVLTLNGGTFVAGEATNGLNMGEIVAGKLKRAIDPVTEIYEKWSGLGEVAGSATSCRWYANDATTGLVTDKCRMDGQVNTSGGDLNMDGTTLISIGVESLVNDVQWGVSTA